MARLLKIIGPSVARFEGLTWDEAMWPLIIDSIQRVEPAEADSLICEMLCNAYAVKDGKQYPLSNPAVIDTVFERIPDLWAALKFSFEVNFSDFFQEPLGGEQPPVEERRST